MSKNVAEVDAELYFRVIRVLGHFLEESANVFLGITQVVKKE